MEKTLALERIEQGIPAQKLLEEGIRNLSPDTIEVAIKAGANINGTIERNGKSQPLMFYLLGMTGNLFFNVLQGGDRNTPNKIQSIIHMLNELTRVINRYLLRSFDSNTIYTANGTQYNIISYIDLMKKRDYYSNYSPPSNIIIEDIREKFIKFYNDLKKNIQSDIIGGKNKKSRNRKNKRKSRKNKRKSRKIPIF